MRCEVVLAHMKTLHLQRALCGLTVAICGLAAVGVSAQANSLPSSAAVTSFDQLWTKLKSGDTVYVLDTSARETRGRFARVSPASIAVLADGQIREIPFDEVLQVARRGDRLWNGVVIGGAFGAMVGVTVNAASGGCLFPSCVTTAGERTVFVLVVAGVNAAIGAGIDALIRGRTVVYRATPRRTVHVNPIFSGAHGVATASVAVGF